MSSRSIFESDILDDIRDIERRLHNVEIAVGPVAVEAGEPELVPGSVSGGYDPATQTATPSHIITGSVISDTLYSGTIDAWLIRGEHIAADTIETGHLAAGAITTGIIVADAAEINKLQAAHIAAGAITANHIQTVTLDAGQILVGGQLAGSIIAGAIRAGHIHAAAFEGNEFSLKSGGQFRTGDAGTSHLRIGTSIPTSEGNKNGIVGIDASNNITFIVEPSTGDARFKGQVLSGSTGLGNFIDTIVANQVPATLIGGANRLRNSTFLDGTNMWTPAGGTISVIDTSSSLYPPFGRKILQLVRTTGGAAGSLYVLTSSSATQAGYTGDSPTGDYPGYYRVDETKLYTISAYVRSAAISRNVYARLYWYDENRSQTGLAYTTTTGPIADRVDTSTTEWKRAVLRGAQPPPGAKYARVMFNFQNSLGDEVHYLCCPQLEEGSVVTAYGPRPDEILPDAVGASELQDLSSSLSGDVTSGSTLLLVGGIAAGQMGVGSLAAGVIAAKSITAAQIKAGSITASELFIRPGGGNMLVNSSWEDTRSTLQSWSSVTGGTAAIDSTTLGNRLFGSRGLAITPTALGSACYFGQSVLVNLPSGTRMVFSVWAKGTTSLSRTLSAMIGSLKLSDGTSNANLFPALVEIGSTNTRPVNGQWRRFAAVFDLPTDVRSISPHIHMNSGVSGSDDNGTVYFDGAQLELGDIPTAYSPRPDEILPNTVTTTMIGPGEIKTGNIEAGAIKVQHVGFAVPGNNLVPNSSFENPDAPLAGWQFSQSSGAGYGAVTTPTPVHGIQACKLVATTVANMWIGKRDVVADRIPVIAGKTYTFSAWIRTDSVVRAVNIYTYWYTSADALISTIIGVNDATGVPVVNGTMNDSTSWQRIVFTATAPANAVKCGFLFHFINCATSEIHYIDAIQIQEGEIATAYSPSVDEILPRTIGTTHIKPGAITVTEVGFGIGGGNYLYNSSFEAFDSATNLPTSWTGSGVSSLSVVGEAGHRVHGDKSIRFQGSGDVYVHQSIPAEEVVNLKGKKVTLSAWVRYGTGTLNTTGSDRLLFIDTGAGTATLTRTSAATLFGLAQGQWTRVWLTYTVPLTATYLQCRLYSQNAPSGGDWTRFDAVQLEAGDVPTSFEIRGGDPLPNTIGSTHIQGGSIKTNHISVSLHGANLFKNSGFYSDTSGVPTDWTAFQSTLATQSSGGPLGSNKYLRVTTQAVAQSGPWQNVYNLIGGQVYTVSVYSRRGAASQARSLIFWADWYDASGTIILQEYAVVGTPVSSGWNRYSKSFTAHANAVRVRIYFLFDTTANGETFDLANAQIEQGDVLTNWKQYIDPTVIDGSSITSALITGSTIRTSASNPKLQMDSTGLFSYDSSGVENFRMTGAEGLEFQQGTATSRQIIWKQSSSVIAGIGGYQDGGTYSFTYLWSRKGNRANSGILLEAEMNNGSLTSFTINEGGIVATHKGFQNTLINNDGDMFSWRNITAAGKIFAGDWFRGTNDRGFYQEGRDVGWYATDGTYFRVYPNNARTLYSRDVLAEQYLQTNFAVLVGAGAGSAPFFGRQAANAWDMKVGRSDNGGHGWIYAAGYPGTSDPRLKVEPKKKDVALKSTGGKVMPKLKGINAIKHKWRDHPEHMGEAWTVMYEDVAREFPELVVTLDEPDPHSGEEGLKFVHYQYMIPLLLESIKELSEEIEALKAKGKP